MQRTLRFLSEEEELKSPKNIMDWIAGRLQAPIHYLSEQSMQSISHSACLSNSGQLHERRELVELMSQGELFCWQRTSSKDDVRWRTERIWDEILALLQMISLIKANKMKSTELNQIANEVTLMSLFSQQNHHYPNRFNSKQKIII